MYEPSFFSGRFRSPFRDIEAELPFLIIGAVALSITTLAVYLASSTL
jgi:hypothetical protein